MKNWHSIQPLDNSQHVGEELHAIDREKESRAAKKGLPRTKLKKD
jgi:hypothetical protein